jgi:peptidoglycan-associated lipoprotein
MEQAVADMQANFARVHFAYDSATLDASSKAALEDNARIMKNHPRLTVEVQGHCDERGTTDYNLALGNKRAAAVRDHLTAMGVAPNRVATLSYGEERPVAMGADESSWSQNRRAEFRVLVSEPGVAGTVN